MSAALALLKRDVKLSWREGGAIGVALGFYLVVVAITPLGLGPDLNLLARIVLQMPPEPFIAQIRAILDAPDELRAELVDVNVPTLVITGSQD